MDLRRARVVVETERHRILGSVALPREGYRSRLTDFLNAAERDFLALTDVVMTRLDGTQETLEREFVAVSLRHVVLVMPIDDEPPAPRSAPTVLPSRLASPSQPPPTG